MKRASEMTKKELLTLPDAVWNQGGTWYESLLMIPLRTKHESGYAHIALIGVDKDGYAREVLTRCSDDIQMPFAPAGYARLGMAEESDLRFDCFHPSGVLKLWSRRYQFRVSYPVSSVRIEVRIVDQ